MLRLYHSAVKGPNRVIGRSVRPTALGLLIFTAAFGWSSFTSRTFLQGQLFGQIVAVLCIAAAVFFAVGFLVNRAVLARVGYLLTFFVLVTNSIFVWIELGGDWWYKMVTFAPKTTSVWMGLGVAVIAAGAYWLEGIRE
jgi:hypothetical protein